MEIKHEESGGHGEFYIDSGGGGRIARLQYRTSGDNEITIYHTEVDETLRGQHVGDKLVRSAVEFARDKGLKIVADCPFAKKVLGRTAEFRDVLA